MPFWSEPRSDECNFLSVKLSTLCSALMNSFVPSTNQVLPLLEQLTQRTRDRGKLLQSPYLFRPFTPTLLTPPPLPTGILYSPQFRSHEETKMAATELKNDCACVTGDPVGQSRSRLPSRRDIWRENIDLNNTFRMKDPRVS